MRTLTFCTSLLALLLALTPLCSHAADGMTVPEMAVTTKVVKGKPIDSVRRISAATVDALYCFTRTSSASDGETVIRHRWFRDGALVKESELPVKGKRWRTYSRQSVDRSSVGNWRVDAVDAEGRTMRSVSFRIN